MASFLFCNSLAAIVSLPVLGPPQTRHLVVDNYLLSITKCYRQLKNVVCETSRQQLNAKFLVVDN